MASPGQASPIRLMPPRTGPRRNGQGFTLVEIIAVLIILGVLAAVMVPRYSGVIDTILHVSAGAAVGEATTRLHGATQLYTVTTGTPPKLLDDIASADYLNLNAGSKVSVGSYDAAYTQDVANGVITIVITNTGDSLALANATIPWP